ncbi:hypothetical protein Q7P37_008788 [Cladosporium fusiforme]
MGRMTRAKAAAVAEQMHIEEDAVLELPSEATLASPDANPATPERAVLGEIAPNSTESKAPVEIAARKTRGKKKTEEKAATPEKQVDVLEQDAEVAAVEEREEGQDEEEHTEEDALDATTNETMERLAKLRITSIGSQPAVQAASPAQIEQSEPSAVAPESLSPVLDEAETTQNEQVQMPIASPTAEEPSMELPSISIDANVQPEGIETPAPEDHATFELEAPGSPVASAVPKVIKKLRMETPGKRSTSNKENVEPLEPVEPAQTTSPAAAASAQPASPSRNVPLDTTATQSASPSSGRRPSSSKSEDPIEAMDDLDDAVEKVNLEIPNLTSSPNEKRSEKPAEEKAKPKKSKPAPVVRLTKATQARLSMAQGASKDTSKASSAPRPRPSTTLGRASSVRQSVVPSAARQDPKFTSTSNKPEARPKKETVIPHSKPRPVSLSFPTPPPPPKSSKAPTKSTFQLPGEAVAAKLKAAREERLKREASQAASKSKEKSDAAAAEKKPAFKARPVPSALKATPSIRQTAASRARDSTINSGASTSTTKRPIQPSTSKAAAPKPRPSTSTAPAHPITVSKRPRPSSVQLPATTTTTAPRSTSASTSTSKGKEVYARAAAAKDAAEASKREKEDAARKARAAAAERGRAASREWAEKQKSKKAAAASAVVA